MRIKFLLFLLVLSCTALVAQPGEQYVKVNVVPKNINWECKVGDYISFDISVSKSGVNLKEVEIRYEISEDMMPLRENKIITLQDGIATISAGKMTSPGFLRCQVYAKFNGKEYSNRATVAVNPESIEPVTQLPSDFISFWNTAKEEAGKIPMDAKVTLWSERCTEKVNTYKVNIQNYRKGTRLFGVLCIPRAKGKYPAIFKVPGAGARPYFGDVVRAEQGAITFEIGIHGIPIDLPTQAYDDLRYGALMNYSSFNLDSKNDYYYKRVYLGCVRAVDFIYSLDEFDGENIIVSGGSQGGALAIVTAGLDDRIKGLISFYPALSDMAGYLYDRAGGWPHMFKNLDKKDSTVANKVEVAQYYDVVNFARQVKVPGFYSFGYNDMVCPPTSIYSVYNSIKAPKEKLIVLETAHWAYPEQWEVAWKWGLGLLKNK